MKLVERCDFHASFFIVALMTRLTSPGMAWIATVLV